MVADGDDRFSLAKLCISDILWFLSRTWTAQPKHQFDVNARFLTWLQMGMIDFHWQNYESLIFSGFLLGSESHSPDTSQRTFFDLVADGDDRFSLAKLWISDILWFLSRTNARFLTWLQMGTIDFHWQNYEFLTFSGFFLGPEPDSPDTNLTPSHVFWPGCRWGRSIFIGKTMNFLHFLVYFQDLNRTAQTQIWR